MPADQDGDWPSGWSTSTTSPAVSCDNDSRREAGGGGSVAYRGPSPSLECPDANGSRLFAVYWQARIDCRRRAQATVACVQLRRHRPGDPAAQYAGVPAAAFCAAIVAAASSACLDYPNRQRRYANRGVRAAPGQSGACRYCSQCAGDLRNRDADDAVRGPC